MNTLFIVLMVIIVLVCFYPLYGDWLKKQLVDDFPECYDPECFDCNESHPDACDNCKHKIW